jgi:hypothetical protein
LEIRETAQLLGKAALIDNRNVDAQIVAAWHEAIGHLDYRTALAALDKHRATSREYLLPAHINELAKVVRRDAELEEARTRALYALPAPKSGGVPDWFWERAGIQRTTTQAPPWPCPWCGARELEPCTNRGKRAAPVHNGIHPQRQAVPTGAASVIQESK